MINPKIERFLEENNMNYLYLILANLEVDRLSKLPGSAKEALEKITELALEHVAINEIPDYVLDFIEENLTEDDDI